MPDRRRRIHPRMPSHRRGRGHSLGPGDRGPGPPGQRTRRPAPSALGQRPGVRLQSPAAMGYEAVAGHGLDRSRQAVAKRHCREFQRQVSGRMPFDGVVSLSDGSQGGD